MDYDAFTAGVEPGGLRNSADISVLICYMLNTIDKPMKKEYIITAIQQHGLANYFEVNAAIAELLKNGNIKAESDDTYTVTEHGRMIARQLDSTLPYTTRDKAVSASIKLLERQKLERENPVKVEKLESGGYNVTFGITDGKISLMSFTVFLPTSSQVELVKKNFYDDPQFVYSVLLSTLTKNKELLKDALDKIVIK